MKQSSSRQASVFQDVGSYAGRSLRKINSCPDLSNKNYSFSRLASRLTKTQNDSMPAYHSSIGDLSSLIPKATSSPLHAGVSVSPLIADNVVKLIRDIETPHGLAAISCVEQFGQLNAPDIRSDETDSFEGCLSVPTQEESSLGDGIWNQVKSCDINRVLLKRAIRRKRLRKFIYKKKPNSTS